MNAVLKQTLGLSAAFALLAAGVCIGLFVQFSGPGTRGTFASASASASSGLELHGASRLKNASAEAESSIPQGGDPAAGPFRAADAPDLRAAGTERFNGPTDTDRGIVAPAVAASSGLVGAGDIVLRTRIRVKGSDTMIQLGVAWAEAYHKVNPGVLIELNGGGTGTGVSALLNGYCDLLNASRELTPEERANLKSLTGKEAVEFVVAYDALAVYSNPKNSLREISIEDLREIWSEGGTITSWELLNPKLKGGIVLFGRQNNSGYYDYFRETICGKTSEMKPREFRNGITEMNGSADVVENVARTALGLGYAGMGYKTPRVNWLRVSSHKGEPGVEPGANSARSAEYPISRKLYLYTAGEPTGEVKAYIDWILSPAGQKIVEQEGFVPLK